jgi:hypothetical protein
MGETSNQSAPTKSPGSQRLALLLAMAMFVLVC